MPSLDHLFDALRDLSARADVCDSRWNRHEEDRAESKALIQGLTNTVGALTSTVERVDTTIKIAGVMIGGGAAIAGVVAAFLALS